MNRKFDILNRYPEIECCKKNITEAIKVICDTYYRKGKLLLCGNGGSSADCDHIVGELMKGFVLKRKLPLDDRIKFTSLSSINGEYIYENLQGALPAISLTAHTSLVSAFSNDVVSDMIFAQQVYGFGNHGDTLIAISTSGKSKNTIYAVEVARAIGIKTIGLTGLDGGMLKDICDITISAPSSITHIIQEYHLAIYHYICLAVESEFFTS